MRGPQADPLYVGTFRPRESPRVWGALEQSMGPPAWLSDSPVTILGNPDSIIYEKGRLVARGMRVTGGPHSESQEGVWVGAQRGQ